jgi:hypothetical protein
MCNLADYSRSAASLRVAGPYYPRYLRWLKGGLPVHEAYLERAGAHNKARAFLQARADAQAAVYATESSQLLVNRHDQFSHL